MDTPWLVPDIYVRGCVLSCGGMFASTSTYRLLFSVVLDDRNLSVAATEEIIQRGNGFGPLRYEDTWEALMLAHCKPDVVAFWRTPTRAEIR